MIASASLDLCSYQRYSTWIWNCASPRTSSPQPGGAFELREAAGAIAAGQQQQEAQEPEDRRRDAGVVAVHADAELGVVHRRIERQRLLERLLDPLAVAGGGEPLDAVDAELRAHAVGGAEVEPGLGAVRLGRGPSARLRRSRGCGGQEGGVEAAASGSSWICHHRLSASRPRHATIGAGGQVAGSVSFSSSKLASRIRS